jgi:acyl phosphate:glycerol-3-phosphate acyltransferase
MSLLIIAYLLGTWPTGIIVAKLFGLGDLRTIGSGNIGATNVLRTGRKLAAALTLLGDGGKGILAVALMPQEPLWALYAAMIGHIWPVWFGFRGGKGIATLMGGQWMLLGVWGALPAATWLTAVKVTGVSAIGGLTGTIAVPIALWLSGGPWWAALPLSPLMLWTHRENLVRLWQGDRR